jgi:branched-chain amino acid transport system substrate-binding protein
MHWRATSQLTERILASAYAFGHQLQADATNVITAAGGKVLAAARHPLNTADFSSFLRAQSSGAKDATR